MTHPELEQDTPWLHLAPTALVFLCLRALLRWLRENVPILLGAGVGATLVDAITLPQVLVVGLTLLGVGLMICIAYYRRYRFRLSGRRLIVQKGLLERSETDLTAEQIQQVMIDRPLYLRMFGLARLSLDTAGGASAEVELPGISESLARALHGRLQTSESSGSSGTHDAASAPLIRVGFPDLLLHGLASNHAWLLFAAAMPLLQRLQRLLEERWQEWGPTRALGDWLQTSWLALPMLALTLLLALAALSMIAVVLRYGAFRLDQAQGQADVLRQSGGLLSRREQYLQLSRLRLVEWIQTPVGRLLNRCHLICRQFGSIEDGRDLSSQVFTIPGLTPTAATRLLPLLHQPTLPARDLWRPVNRAYRRVLFLRLALPAALLCGLLAWQQGGAGPWLGLAALVPVLALISHLRWRAIGWRLTDGDALLVRRGLIGHRITLFRLQHVQHVSVRQSLFQRRRRLASIQLALATGGLLLPWISARDAWDIGHRVRRSAVDPAPAPQPAAG